MEIPAANDNSSSEVAIRERVIKKLKQTKENIKRQPNQHTGFGERGQRDRVKRLTVGQEIKGFGDSLDKEEERDAVCLTDTCDNQAQKS